MLAEDAFLRQLPSGLAPVQAIQIEALVYCGDAVEASYRAIKSIALAHGKEITAADRRHARVSIFIHAWTIVDCVHVARDMLRDMGDPSDQSLQFQTKYEVATLLRNKMDHVAKQAENLAARKDQPPLFGMISYAVERLEKNGAEFTLGDKGNIVAISLGRFHTSAMATDYKISIDSPSNALRATFASADAPAVKATMGTYVNPLALPLPVVYAEDVAASGGLVAHGFLLSGFKAPLELPLEAAANDLIALLHELNDRLSELLPRQVEKRAESEGLDLDRAMRPALGDMGLMLKFRRRNDSPNATDASH
jgi:hypothetical protein